MPSAQRLEESYRERFRELLARVAPRRLEFGVELLIERARVRREGDRVPFAQALSEIYDATRERVERRVAAIGACAIPSGSLPPAPLADPPRFVCDGSLGGLARWLRAAGYEALRVAGGGERALGEALRSGGMLLTGDAAVLGRRSIAAASLPALYVAPGVPRAQQLAAVLRWRSLKLRPARCMACGAALRPVAKQAVIERIPPRTAGWKDEYFLCAGCGRLFWRGTHWERISRRLEALIIQSE